MYSEFTNSISFNDNRYEVCLLWKESHPVLPDNYSLSHRRLTSLLKRLKHDPSTLQAYNDVIQDQLTQGIIEVVDKPESGDVGKVHYLPHHAIIRREKQTTKLCIAYDASARTEGVSLNDCLHTGPTFGQNIMDILLRFRSHNVALAADIKKAFLMILMAERDRDALRFLWVDNVSKAIPNVVVLRFTRVAFGVSCSPFLLNATVKHHLECS